MINPDHARLKMVEEQLVPRGITDARVLEAMRKVPRHLFLEEALADRAYEDSALPIGEKQTISQPYIVALMTQALALRPTDKVLEIGTGSGYQTAILAELAERVYSIERVKSLALQARERLDRMGCRNVAIRIGDGPYGWGDAAPFDAILVAAGSPSVPPLLVEQLREGGRLVIPVEDLQHASAFHAKAPTWATVSSSPSSGLSHGTRTHAEGLQHHDRPEGPVRAAGARPGPDVCVRRDGLRRRSPGPRPQRRRLRRHPAIPGIPRLQRHVRQELHGRGRQDHQPGPGIEPAVAGRDRPVHRCLLPRYGAPWGPPGNGGTQGHRTHGGDHPAHTRAS